MTDRSTLLAVRLIAARAEKLADDLERGRLWPGEMEDALAEIDAARRSIPSNQR